MIRPALHRAVWMLWARPQRPASWPYALRRYFVVSAAGHAVWELLQLPLYTVFWTDLPREIAFAVLHCTGGDLLIAASSLFSALVLFADQTWPQPSRSSLRVALAIMSIGLGYTIFSEWWNTAMRGNWSYTELMPVLPLLGTGLAPLGQWIVVPALAIGAAGAWRATPRACSSTCWHHQS